MASVGSTILSFTATLLPSGGSPDRGSTITIRVFQTPSFQGSELKDRRTMLFESEAIVAERKEQNNRKSGRKSKEPSYEYSSYQACVIDGDSKEYLVVELVNSKRGAESIVAKGILPIPFIFTPQFPPEVLLKNCGVIGSECKFARTENDAVNPFLSRVPRNRFRLTIPKLSPSRQRLPFLRQQSPLPRSPFHTTNSFHVPQFLTHPQTLAQNRLSLLPPPQRPTDLIIRSRMHDGEQTLLNNSESFT